MRNKLVNTKNEFIVEVGDRTALVCVFKKMGVLPLISDATMTLISEEVGEVHNLDYDLMITEQVQDIKTWVLGVILDSWKNSMKKN